MVVPKKDGRLVEEKTLGGEEEETVAVTREKRRPTKSVEMEAGVEPLAAVKEVRRTATVWPGRRTVVSLAFWKAVASAGTSRPLESTEKTAPAARLTVTGAARARLAPIRLFEGARKMSLAAIWNWLEEVGTDVTTPSIQSEATVCRGSNSRRVKVPSELRATSTAASWFWVAQSAREGEGAVQLGEKKVEELATAVMAPCLEVVIVTEDPEIAVTTPVKSSTKSS